MQPWQEVFRSGVAPSLSTKALEALASALREDDPRLVQGRTVVGELPRSCTGGVETEVPVGACAIAYAGWQGEKLATSKQVRDFFNSVLEHCSRRLDTRCPMAAAPFTVWFDNSRRQEMRTALLAEVEQVLYERSLCQRQGVPGALAAASGVCHGLSPTDGSAGFLNRDEP